MRADLRGPAGAEPPFSSPPHPCLSPCSLLWPSWAPLDSPLAPLGSHFSGSVCLSWGQMADAHLASEHPGRESWGELGYPGQRAWSSLWDCDCCAIRPLGPHPTLGLFPWAVHKPPPCSPHHVSLPLQYACGIQAHVVGKPSPEFFKLALRELGVEAHQVSGPGAAFRGCGVWNPRVDLRVFRQNGERGLEEPGD